jgi:hypothetical protein
MLTVYFLLVGITSGGSPSSTPHFHSCNEDCRLALLFLPVMTTLQLMPDVKPFLWVQDGASSSGEKPTAGPVTKPTVIFVLGAFEPRGSFDPSIFTFQCALHCNWLNSVDWSTFLSRSATVCSKADCLICTEPLGRDTMHAFRSAD